MVLKAIISFVNLQVLFDHNMCLKIFSSPSEIMKVFYEVHQGHYHKRKAWLEGKLTAESTKATYQVKFIFETVEKKLENIGMYACVYHT